MNEVRYFDILGYQQSINPTFSILHDTLQKIG